LFAQKKVEAVTWGSAVFRSSNGGYCAWGAREGKPEMAAPTELFVAVFPDKASAQATVDAIARMDKSGAVKLIDAAQVAKDESGKVTVDELAELTSGKGALGGAIVGGVLGLIFPPTLLVGAAIGGIAGAITGRLLDTGAKTKDLKHFADNIEPGEVAVIALVEDRWVSQLTLALQGYDRVFQKALSAREAAALRIDHDTGEITGTMITSERAPATTNESSNTEPDTHSADV
jgi:uncharacterized membrane protein